MEWTDGKLIYRYAMLGDLPRIIEMLDDPEVGRWLWFTPAEAEKIEAFFRPLLEAQAEALERHEVPSSAEFVVHDRESGGFLGQGAVIPVDGSPNGYEIGYQMARASWGKGNGRRLARFLTAYAVVKLSAHRLQAGAIAGNAASIAVMRSLGLRHEATLREYRALRGQRCDEVIYGAPVSELDTEEIRRWAVNAGLA